MSSEHCPNIIFDPESPDNPHVPLLGPLGAPYFAKLSGESPVCMYQVAEKKSMRDGFLTATRFRV